MELPTSALERMSLSTRNRGTNRFQVSVDTYPRTGHNVSKMDFVSKRECHPEPGQSYLPVTREEGFMFSGENSKYCGTFYFYEPDSPYYLNLGKCLIAGGKVDAILQLEGKTDFRESNGGLAFSQARLALLEFVNHLFPNSLPHGWKKETEAVLEGEAPNEEIEARLNKYFSTRGGERILAQFRELSKVMSPKEIDDFHLDIPYYDSQGRKKTTTINALYESIVEKPVRGVKHVPRLYQGGPFQLMYQYLDQYICQLANAEGYDTVLFQRELSADGVATEILDTRDRKDSYNSICHETNFQIAPPETAYPRIWTPDLQFMEYPEGE